ncbi:MAG: hypothetical protein FJ244_02075 [Nitrospira sp.]|nr:hypothetical protein [Nitrospira sp.]
MNRLMRYSLAIELLVWGTLSSLALAYAGDQPASGEAPEIEITKKGLGKQVVISQGAKEWFMLIDVTPDNSVVLRQEKDRDQYLIDESETHDRAMTQSEVDAAIVDYVNSVKTRMKKP